MAWKKVGKSDPKNYTTLKVRLYPTAEQAELFEKTFGCCRYIWNRMLADQQRFYVETDAHFIPTPAKYKREAPFLKEVDNQALIQEHNQLVQAFRVFFKNPEAFGYPRYKRKKEKRDSFTACNHEFESGPTIYLTKDGIRMTKAGIVKAKIWRRPGNGWKLKRITVRKTRSGKYFCSIVYDCGARAVERIEPTVESTVGLKMSLRHFYVADTGERGIRPRWLRESQEKLVELQRRLSRKERGSRRYEELVKKYRELHEHIANQRLDYIHKASRRISNDWGAVCVRGDDIAAMGRELELVDVRDVGYGIFRKCLRYKLERQGKQLIEVERYTATTRRCSECGAVREAVGYREGTWKCERCGAVHEREVNAAKNIKAEGLAQYGARREAAA